MIFGFFVQKTQSVPICKVLASLEVILCTKNVICSLSRHAWNLKNAILWKPLGVTSSNFQDYLVFMIPTTGESLKKIWEVWVTFSFFSGWFDMELACSHTIYRTRLDTAYQSSPFLCLHCHLLSRLHFWVGFPTHLSLHTGHRSISAECCLWFVGMVKITPHLVPTTQ